MTQIGNQYAAALYSLAADENLADRILEELKLLDSGFSENPDYLRLLRAPNIPKEERCQVIDNSFKGRVHPYLLNFLKILTEKGYAHHFSDCRKAFETQYNEEHGILPVCAVTAVPLTENQQERLIQKLQRMTGKTVELTNQIDPNVFGGVRLHYDGKQVDGTVKNRLDTIGKLLKETVL